MPRYTLEDCRDDLLREFARFERRVLDSIEHFEVTLTRELRGVRRELDAFRSDADRGFDLMERRFDELKGDESDKR